MNELKTLSNSELLLSTQNAVKVERDAITNVTRHFQEIFRRKLYLPKYNSMFEMLTKEFGYCAGSAQIRINAMRLAWEVPMVREKLESNELSMSAASNIQRFITAEKRSQRPVAPAAKAELVSKCLGKTIFQIEKEFAKLSPHPFRRDVVRPVSANEVRANVNLSDKAHTNLKALQHILSHVDPNMSLGQLIERLSEDGLDKYCPKRKAERAKRRAERKEIEKEVLTDSTSISSDEMKSRGPNSLDEIEKTRYVPAKEKHQVANNKKFCSFVDPGSGRKCESTKFLQLDHVQPYSKGGENTANNLRWMCGTHNRWRYENRAH